MIGWYRDREPAPFRAVQYDGTNADEVIEFTNGAAFMHLAPFDCFGKPALWLKEPDMTEELPVGYWVILGADGTFFISYEPEEFEQDFAPE